MNNKKIMAFAMTFAMIGAGFTVFSMNIIAEDSARPFETQGVAEGYPAGGLTKISWDGSGDFALAVDDGSIIYRYDRTSGMWGVEGSSANPSDNFMDIVYDDYFDRFMIVGDNGGDPAMPIAYNYTVGGNWEAYGTAASMGTFNGVCMAHEYGSTVYSILAVGTSGGNALAKWYNDNTDLWEDADLTGFNIGDILYDCTWDYFTPTTYFAVGEDTNTKGIIRSWSTPGTDYATDITIQETAALNTIDWNSDIGSYDYAIVGGNYHANGNIFYFDGGVLDMLDNKSYNILDFDWSPDGTWGAAVGDHAGAGVYYACYAATSTAKDMTYKLPGSVTTLFGVSVKGYSSPSSAVATGGPGAPAITGFVSSTNSDTKLMVNTDVPHGFDVDMWLMSDGTQTSTLDTSVNVDSLQTYTFRGEFNYTIGGAANDQFFDGLNDNVRVDLTAWYDNGIGGSLSNPVVGPDGDDRTRQFQVTWEEGIGADTAAMNYPIGAPNEFILDSWWSEASLTPNQYYVFINVTFNVQTWAADGQGFGGGTGGLIYDQNVMLNDLDSWDFSFEIYDAAFITANNYTYGEFGIFMNTDLIVTGDPSGNAPPGTFGTALFPYSNITYHSNIPYYVNVSIEDLSDGVNTIDAFRVDVQHVNINGLATVLNTDMFALYDITGADAEVGVWGIWNTADEVLPAPYNGTTANGPWGSNFNPEGSLLNDETQIRWWIDVPAGTTEGMYSATITITIGYYP